MYPDSCIGGWVAYTIPTHCYSSHLFSLFLFLSLLSCSQEDLLAELEGLEDELDMVEEETEKAPAIPTKPQAQAQQTPAPEAVFNFPNAPQGQLQQPVQQTPVAETEDERAIRELQESMLA